MIHLMPSQRHISACKAILSGGYHLTAVNRFGCQRVSEGLGAPLYVYKWLQTALRGEI